VFFFTFSKPAAKESNRVNKNEVKTDEKEQSHTKQTKHFPAPATLTELLDIDNLFYQFSTRPAATTIAQHPTSQQTTKAPRVLSRRARTPKPPTAQPPTRTSLNHPPPPHPWAPAPNPFSRAPPASAFASTSASSIAKKEENKENNKQPRTPHSEARHSEPARRRVLSQLSQRDNGCICAVWIRWLPDGKSGGSLYRGKSLGPPYKLDCLSLIYIPKYLL